MDNESNRHREQTRIALDLFGIRDLITIGWLGGPRRWLSKDAASTAIDRINPKTLEFARKHHTLLRTPARIVLDRQTHEQGLCGWPARTDRFGNLKRKAHPFGLSAAVCILTLVGKRRQKFMDQKTMRAMQLDHVKTGSIGSLGCLGEVLDHRSDFVDTECTWHRPTLIGSKCARGH